MARRIVLSAVAMAMGFTADGVAQRRLDAVWASEGFMATALRFDPDAGDWTAIEPDVSVVARIIRPLTIRETTAFGVDSDLRFTPYGVFDADRSVPVALCEDGFHHLDPYRSAEALDKDVLLCDRGLFQVRFDRRTMRALAVCPFGWISTTETGAEDPARTPSVAAFVCEEVEDE